MINVLVFKEEVKINNIPIIDLDSIYYNDKILKLCTIDWAPIAKIMRLILAVYEYSSLGMMPSSW